MYDGSSRSHSRLLAAARCLLKSCSPASSSPKIFLLAGPLRFGDAMFRGACEAVGEPRSAMDKLGPTPPFIDEYRPERRALDTLLMALDRLAPGPTADKISDILRLSPAGVPGDDVATGVDSLVGDLKLSALLPRDNAGVGRMSRSCLRGGPSLAKALTQEPFANIRTQPADGEPVDSGRPPRTWALARRPSWHWEPAVVGRPPSSPSSSGWSRVRAAGLPPPPLRGRSGGPAASGSAPLAGPVDCSSGNSGGVCCRARARG
mmetsp:Transcript_58822/g.165978  ORF Transcript_58822/g.165978 Transcript_58822/m.165978 type:complete len:262 (+) Transcript_58822:586-1371(+)